MRDRSFIAAVALVGTLALLILAGNIRDASAPLYGPPNVDEDEVRAKVESGALSFREAEFYSIEDHSSDGSESVSAPESRGEGGADEKREDGEADK
jgi:hypothetical protein